MSEGVSRGKLGHQDRNHVLAPALHHEYSGSGPGGGPWGTDALPGLGTIRPFASKYL
jgi:hypothetical protein